MSWHLIVATYTMSMTKLLNTLISPYNAIILNGGLLREHSTWAQNCQILSMADTCLQMYRISSIKRRGYYYFAGRFVWLLFEGGYYLRAAFISLESLETPTMGWIGFVRVRQWRLLDAVSSMRSLSLLLTFTSRGYYSRAVSSWRNIVTIDHPHPNPRV